jgi:hypothetical protein
VSLLVLALASGVGLWLCRQTFVWTPLQRFYLSAYTRSAVASSLGIRTGRYRVLLMENRRASRLAIDDEVVPIALSTGETTFALSALAREAASGRLAWRDLVYDHARFHAQLRVWIYADQTLTELARPSLIAAFAVFIAGMLIAIPKDAQWDRSRRHGRRLKGPELVSARRFNRRMRANGIAFRQMSSLPAKLLGIRPTLRIPRAIESSHLLAGERALVTQLHRPGDARWLPWRPHFSSPSPPMATALLSQRVCGVPVIRVERRWAAPPDGGALGGIPRRASGLRRAPPTACTAPARAP